MYQLIAIQTHTSAIEAEAEAIGYRLFHCNCSRGIEAITYERRREQKQKKNQRRIETQCVESRNTEQLNIFVSPFDFSHRNRKHFGG